MNDDLLDQLLDRAVCLCDVGAPQYLAATTIGNDGDTHFVLALADAIGDEETRYDPSVRSASHEQTGPLPGGWRERIWAPPVEFFCVGTNSKGMPCGLRVQRQGDRCVFHRERQASR
jgi:hypothetical protein